MSNSCSLYRKRMLGKVDGRPGKRDMRWRVDRSTLPPNLYANRHRLAVLRDWRQSWSASVLNETVH